MSKERLHLGYQIGQAVGTVTDAEYQEFLRAMRLIKESIGPDVPMWQHQHKRKLAKAMQLLWWEKVRERLGVPYGPDCLHLAFNPTSREMVVADDNLAMRFATEAASNVWDDVDELLERETV